MVDTIAVNAVPGPRIRWTPPDGAPIEREIVGEVTVGRGAGCDIVIDDPTVSRAHARIRSVAGRLTIEDLGSRNGTIVNGEVVASAELHPGDSITLGVRPMTIVDPTPNRRAAISSDGLRVLEPPRPQATVIAPGPTDDSEPPSAIPRQLLEGPIISERDLVAAGVDLTITDIVALGSGLGSFVFVDALRIGGVAPGSIAVIGSDPVPFARYQRLCTNSQIPPHERLRSNSDSCPDNLWGFPGYAVREMWGNLRRGDVRTTAQVLWSIFGESAIADTYTPRSGDVFGNVAKESKRISWDRMFRYGRIRTIRKTEEGRILVVASEGEGPTHRQYAVSARFVHLALGYPAIQLLPDLAAYRERTNDRAHVVNAYEPHAAMYHDLEKRGGTVVLRGRGIVASRVLQRLYEARAHNQNITVIHLHRSRLSAGRRYGWSQRKVDGEFEFQAFNWPKGCWTGPQRYALESASPEERKGLLELWGGTTTANRSDWRRIVATGIRDGWYRQEYGIVKDVVPTDDGRVRIRIANTLPGGGVIDLPTDYVVDCTGLIASPERAPVLDDLIDLYGLPRNPSGRFDISNDFELRGMRHGDARMFAAGASTLGGPFATVDSFLGLQYAAVRAVNAMADSRVAGLHRLNPFQSIAQWWKWARRVSP